jgi:hypothetical protein
VNLLSLPVLYGTFVCADLLLCVWNLWFWWKKRDWKGWLLNFPVAIAMAIYAAYWWYRMRWPF